MRKIIIILALLVITAASSYAFNKSVVIIKISDKAFLDNLVKEKINTLNRVKINTLNCTLTGQVWGDTYSLDCPDGGSVTYVTVGIVWELNCEGAYNNIPWSYSVAYCTDIESSPVGGVGCY